MATVTDSTSTAVAAAAKLTTDSIAALSTALGVTVEAAPTVSAVTKTTITVAAPVADGAESKVEDWMVALIAVGAVALLAACSLIVFMAAREKAGRPMFTTLDASVSAAAKSQIAVTVNGQA